MKTFTKQKRKINLLITLIAIFAISFSLSSCNQGSNDKTTENETADLEQANQPVEVAESVEVDEWYIDEQVIMELPQVNIQAASEKKSPEKGIKVNEKSLTKDESGSFQADELDSALMEVDYVPTVVTVKKAIIPLDETQTVVAYTKKGKDKDAMQVVSNSDGSVDKVVFYNKKHKDVYNVQVGMSGKDVKKLRRDMKHMEKDGKIFLYNDESNIMYLMKAENNYGDEIDAAKIENMQVQAIVWNPSKHDIKKEEREEKKEEKKEEKENA